MTATHASTDLVPAEVPSPQPPRILTFRSRPRAPVRQWAEDREIPDGEDDEHRRDLETPAWTER